MNGFTLCIMAYSSERRVHVSHLQVSPFREMSMEMSKDRFRNRVNKFSIFYAHLCCWTISAVISISTSLWIADANLEPSNTFCFLSFQNRSNSILFFIPLLFFGFFCLKLLKIFILNLKSKEL